MGCQKIDDLFSQEPTTKISPPDSKYYGLSGGKDWEET
jgi:hypothetical protein